MVRLTAVLLSPHHDDETLFASFPICRDRPQVVIVLESHLQANRRNHFSPTLGNPVLITNAVRLRETLGALYELIGEAHADRAEFWPFTDVDPNWDAVDDRLRASLRDRWHATRLYAPAYHHGGHNHHNAVAAIAEEAAVDFSVELVRYTTYVRGDQRVKTQTPVPYEPEWVGRKLRALARYRSQIQLWPHWFIGDQREWYA